MKPLVSQFALLFFVTAAHATYEVKLKGKAFDPDTNELLYYETHKVQCSQTGEPISGHVLYQDAKGRTFAEKSLDFHYSARHPSFVLNDHRDHYTQKVDINTKGIEVKLRKGKDILKADTQVEFPNEEWVIDAGFSAYVRSHWQKLIEGESLHFDFLAVTRQKFYRFELFKLNESIHTLTVRMVPDNWFIAMVLDPIDITYSKDTRSIKSYEGITNLRKNTHPSEYWVARIEYQQGTTACN